MFHSCFFCLFVCLFVCLFCNTVEKLSKIVFWIAFWVLSHLFKAFQEFSLSFLISRLLSLALFGNWYINLLVIVIWFSFDLWWTEIVLKCEKVFKHFFHDYLKIFLLVLTSLEMHWPFKNNQLLVKVLKTL